MKRVLQLSSSPPSLKMMAMTNLGVAYELTNDVSTWIFMIGMLNLTHTLIGSFCFALV
jgi:hypothetical protein